MAPEQCRGEAPTPASDVFSLGLVLYELLAGKHVFDAESPIDTAHSILRTEAKFPAALQSGIPSELTTLVLHMLAKDHAARCSSQEVSQRLASIEVRAEPHPSRKHVYIGLAALAMLVVSTVWAVAGRSRVGEQLNLRPVPLTSQEGWESSPALSPDGNSVAFAWSDSIDAPNQIFVKRLDETTGIRVAGPDRWKIGSPAWSTDGRRIFYKRWENGPGSIWSVDREGNNRTKVIGLLDADTSSALDFSPDGQWLAFTDRIAPAKQISIFLLNLRTAEKRRLTTPPDHIWGDWDPRFSPDGKTVAFKRVHEYWQDYIYLIPAGGGVPRQLTTDRQGIWGHAWMNDGRSLLLSCQRGGTVFGLWRFPVDSSSQPRLISESGFDSIMPTRAIGASRIAWVNQVRDINIYSVSVSGIATPVRVVASTRRDEHPVYAPDGRFAFVSDRSGSLEVWLANADGTRQVKITDFRQGPTGIPSWSSDGRKIVVNAYADRSIVVIECEPHELRCSPPRRRPATVWKEYAPSWSADGTQIYFASNKEQGWNIWRQPAAGGEPVQVTRGGGVLQGESPDGKWLYYIRSRSGIWRRSTGHSENGEFREEKLIDLPTQVETSWTLNDDNLFFFRERSGSEGPGIYGYNITTRKIWKIVAIPSAFGVTVSPDRRQVLYGTLDHSGANVLVADTSEASDTSR
jgi:Tol biopolymer transport system component